MVRCLLKAGFVVVRAKGSHQFLQHGRADNRGPMHVGEILGPGLSSKILRDVELTRDDLISLLR